MIPGIFLAAGEGKRFSSGKLLSLIDGKPLIIRSLKASVESSLEEVFVVLGHQAEIIRKTVEDYFQENGKLKFLINPDYEKGMISSLNKGLAELREGASGTVMILGDMPFVKSYTIDKLIRSWNGKEFLIPEVNGKKTHPRIIPVSVFKDFLEMEILRSGKEVLEKNRTIIKTLSFRNEKEFRDIDVKSDIPDNYL